uniref:Major facilitator superfamily (MFS) profile domain-containing protein n=1 Tax=Ciona savignyi TaxID=51511 RepID=H2YX80_CIOSA
MAAKTVCSNYCLFIVYITQICTFLLLSFTMTSLNPAAPVVQAFINQTFEDRYQTRIGDTTLMVLITSVQSMLLVGSLIGALSAQFVVSYFSRRGSLIFTHVISILSCILMGPVAVYFKTYESIIVGRFLCGFARGVGFTAAPLLISETTTHRTLGQHLSLSGIVVPLGYALGNGVGHPSVLGSETGWPYLVCVPILFSLVYLASVFWIPQTPGWLLKHKTSEEEALKLLKRLRKSDPNAIASEFNALYKEIEMDQNIREATIWEMLKTPKYRQQLICTILVMGSMQTTGISAVALYSNHIFHTAGVKGENATYASIGMHLITFVVTFFFSQTIRKIGTKMLLVTGLGICACSLVCLVIFAALQDLSDLLPYFSIATLIIYTTSVMGGPGIAFVALSSQLTTQTTRPTALYLSAATYWMTGAIVSFVFPFSSAAIGEYAFLPFVAVTVLQIIFASRKVPSTRRKSIVEIQEKLHRKSSKLPSNGSSGAIRSLMLDDSSREDA